MGVRQPEGVWVGQKHLAFCEDPDLLPILGGPEAVVSLGAHLRYPPKVIEEAKGYTRQAILSRVEPDQGYRVFGVEIPIHLDVGASRPVTGILDLVLRDLLGNVWIVDHKTAARVTALTTYQHYRLRKQFAIYDTWGRRNLQGYAGLLVFAIDKPHGGVVHELRWQAPHGIDSLLSWLRDKTEDIVRDELRYGLDPFAWPPRLSGGEGEGCANSYGSCNKIPLCLDGPGAGPGVSRPA